MTFIYTTGISAGESIEGGSSLPAGGTTGQVLAKASGADDDFVWSDPVAGADGVDGVDGADGQILLWKADGNISGTSFDDVENVLVWQNFDITSGADVSLSGTPQSDILINSSGVYKFTVALRTDNGNRTELFIRTYLDEGSGYSELPAQTVSDYVSRDTDQDTGTVVLVTAIDLTSGDSVEFRGFGDTDGTSVGLDNGTRLLIEKVS